MSQREEFEEWHKEKYWGFWLHWKSARLTPPDDTLQRDWETWQAAQLAQATEFAELLEDLTDARSGRESAVMLNNEQAKEINELKYISERLQHHCKELTEQLNIALCKCASLEKANAAYRALEKKRDALAGGEL